MSLILCYPLPQNSQIVLALKENAPNKEKTAFPYSLNKEILGNNKEMVAPTGFEPVFLR